MGSTQPRLRDATFVVQVLWKTRQACSSHNSNWLWDECGDPLRAGAEKVTASKYTSGVTNFLENSCQPSCICVKQSVIFVFSQTSLKPPQKHWWSSLTISDCSFRWNWKYLLRIWWSYLSFSQFCIYFPGDFIRFARRELLVSEMIFLMFFPLVVAPKPIAILIVICSYSKTETIMHCLVWFPSPLAIGIPFLFPSPLAIGIPF